MDSWTPWPRCPGWHNIRYSLSPGHAYHFLENLQYVQRVARHQVRSSPGVARPLSRPPTFILGCLISLPGACLSMLGVFISSALLRLKSGSILLAGAGALYARMCNCRSVYTNFYPTQHHSVKAIALNCYNIINATHATSFMCWSAPTPPDALVLERPHVPRRPVLVVSVREIYPLSYKVYGWALHVSW